MFKSLKKFATVLNKKKKSFDEQGFSLLELVVAVGVLLVLTVGGLLAYSSITDNARQASVNNLADEIYTVVSANLSDTDSTTTIASAMENWAKNAGYTEDQTLIYESATGFTIYTTKTDEYPTVKPAHIVVIQTKTGKDTEGLSVDVRDYSHSSSPFTENTYQAKRG